MRFWQLRCRLDGKDQTATLGKLDRLTLAEARGKADEQRKLAESGEHLTRSGRREMRCDLVEMQMMRTAQREAQAEMHH